MVDKPQNNHDKQASPSARFEDAFTPDAAVAEENPALLQQITELTQALKTAEEKNLQLQEKLLREAADRQNSIRRAEQDVLNAKKFAIERLAQELLAVADSTAQALACGQTASVETLLEGTRLTQQILLGIMEKQGITLIDPTDQVFDPNFHEAISLLETAEHAPNAIVTVVQTGYLLNGRLLRPARVVVAKAKA